MDDLIERLRCENPEPRPESPWMDDVWERIAMNQSARPRGRSGGRPRRRQITSWLPVALSLGTAAVVVAIVLLSASATSSRLPAAGRPVGCAARIAADHIGARDANDVVLTHLVDVIAALRGPRTVHDSDATACAAQSEAETDSIPVPYRPGYRLEPLDLTDIGPGILGGTMFMFARRGVPRAVAFAGVPADSTLAFEETSPSVCLLTVGGAVGSPDGCVYARALDAGFARLGASQILGKQSSVVAGIAADGIRVVRVFDRGRLVRIVPVRHNVVQFIIDHNAPVAARVRIDPVG